tara:strand:- start:9 stop:773 length:765 start_codon:yes stop_codon:yes gene_type:complete
MNLYDTAAFNPDVKSLSSFFETPQFTKDYTQAGNIAVNYPSNWSGPYEKQGLSSDVRHTLGASVGKDAFIDYISQFGVEPTGKIADLYGNLGITAATAAHEIPDAWNIGKQAFKRGDYGAITSGKFLNQPWEDVKANLNVWDIPYGSTEEEKLKQIPTLQAYMQKKATQKDIAQAAIRKNARIRAQVWQKIQQAQTTSGGGGGGSHMSRSRDQGGLGISRAQAQSISDANRAAGMGGWGLADGGLAYLLYGGLV